MSEAPAQPRQPTDVEIVGTFIAHAVPPAGWPTGQINAAVNAWGRLAAQLTAPLAAAPAKGKKP